MLDERFTVRPVAAGDGALMHQIFGDPVVAEWLRPSGEAGGYPLEEAEHTAELDAAHWLAHGFGMWLVLDGDAAVARGGLGQVIVRRRAEVQIGWAVRAERWGQGIATQLGRAALAKARDLGIGGVVAYTRVDNASSRRVMEKLGLRVEDEFLHAGHPHVLCRAAHD